MASIAIYRFWPRLWPKSGFADELEGHPNVIMILSFSPDGSRLASSGFGDKTVRLWNGNTGMLIDILVGHPGNVYLFIFSPDGSRLASRSFQYDDEYIQVTRLLLDVATGRCLGTLDALPDWYSSPTVPCGISISLDRSDRRYHIQGTLPDSNKLIPLLRLLVAVHITQETFRSKFAALGCDDGRVIILDLSKLNLQEIV